MEKGDRKEDNRTGNVPSCFCCFGTRRRVFSLYVHSNNGAISGGLVFLINDFNVHMFHVYTVSLVTNGFSTTTTKKATKTQQSRIVQTESIDFNLS